MKFLLSIAFLLFVFCSYGMEKAIIRAKIDKATNIYPTEPKASYELLIALERDLKGEDLNQFAGEISLGKARYQILITDYESSSKEINKAIQFYKKRKDWKGLANAYSMNAILLERIGESEVGVRFLKQSFSLAKKVRDTLTIIKCVTNLSLSAKRGEDPIVMKYYLLELQKYTSHLKPSDFYYFYQNWGSYYLLIKDFKSAQEHFERARKIAFELNMLDSKATILYLIAKSYRKANRLEEAENWIVESYNFSKANKLIYEESEALAEYIQIMSLKKDYKKSFELQAEFSALDKRILNAEKIRNIKNEVFKQELKLKEIAISESQLRLELESVSKNKYRNYFVFFLLISLLLLFLLLGFWYFFTKIKALNLKISSQTEELVKTNQDLTRLNELNERIFSVISHDFKGPLLSMRLLIEALKKQENQTLSFYTSDIKQQLIQSELILQNLLDWAKSELKLDREKGDYRCNVSKVIDEVKMQLSAQIQSKSLDVENTVPPSVHLNAPEDILKIVYRNLISNAIKYSFDVGKIRCGFLPGQNEFFVQDYGKGMDEESKENLFKDLVASHLGTSMETGFGLGLYLTKELLTKIGGEIWVTSKEAEGSRFSFRVGE